MRIRTGRGLLLVVFLALGVFCGPAARKARGSVLITAGTTSPPVGGAGEDVTFNWTFQVTSDTFDSGDLFAIYDFEGLSSASVTDPLNWTHLIRNAGPVGVAPGNDIDDAQHPNIEWTYGGPSLVVGESISGFAATSHPAADQMVTSVTRSYVWIQSSSAEFFGTSQPPGGGTAGAHLVVAASSTPEPGTLGLFGLGALGLIGFTRRRKQLPRADA